jgi:hypothetical protein
MLGRAVYGLGVVDDFSFVLQGKSKDAKQSKPQAPREDKENKSREPGARKPNAGFQKPEGSEYVSNHSASAVVQILKNNF